MSEAAVLFLLRMLPSELWDPVFWCINTVFQEQCPTPIFMESMCLPSGVPGEEGSTPPPKFRRLSKIVPNSTRLWKLLKIAEFRTPTPQDVRKKGSKILKLPSVRSCFTLAITNKLVVVLNSLKGPKIKKILLYEMQFLVSNYSCLQNPWLGGYHSQIPVLSVLCPQLNLLNPPEQNSWVRHCAFRIHISAYQIKRVNIIEDTHQCKFPFVYVLLYHSMLHDRRFLRRRYMNQTN